MKYVMYFTKEQVKTILMESLACNNIILPKETELEVIDVTGDFLTERLEFRLTGEAEK